MNDEDDLLFGVKPEEPSNSPRITTEPTTHSNTVDCDFNLILGQGNTKAFTYSLLTSITVQEIKTRIRAEHDVKD